MFDNNRHVTFFGEMTLDISKQLPELWNDVCYIAKKHRYMVDAEFNVISLYQEIDSKLLVTKIITGRNKRATKIVKLVFGKTKSTQEEEYEMVGIDGKVPIWKKQEK
ncbi:MAG: hypothetical protein KGI33_08900 [Thaumarchaeota archaeon]|nr:hypothetical protein [Nitrososphaerota archaeon]